MRKYSLKCANDVRRSTVFPSGFFWARPFEDRPEASALARAPKIAIDRECVRLDAAFSGAGLTAPVSIGAARQAAPSKAVSKPPHSMFDLRAGRHEGRPSIRTKQTFPNRFATEFTEL
jgi:hypothetical protein